MAREDGRVMEGTQRGHGDSKDAAGGGEGVAESGLAAGAVDALAAVGATCL